MKMQITDKNLKKAGAILLLAAVIPALAFAGGANEEDDSIPYGYGRAADQSALRGSAMDGTVMERGSGHIVLSAVMEGSPAAEAGLMAGDVIVEINGEMVPPWYVPQLLEEYTAGDSIELYVHRPRSEDSDLRLPEELTMDLILANNDNGDVWVGVEIEAPLQPRRVAGNPGYAGSKVPASQSRRGGMRPGGPGAPAPGMMPNGNAVPRSEL
jgi:membrane-associated protease RseP (regulator of RpoE activity)